MLQWEDFKQHNAIRLLDRYRHRLTCFNDDIQGTAAVVVAGILAALRVRGEPMSAQRIVFLGAGAAGIGIARLAETVMRAEGATAEQIRRAVVMLDSKGLVFEGRDDVADDKRPFALPAAELARLGFEPATRYDLETVVRLLAPTILIGTSGRAGAFTETAIREMAARTPVPVIFPLSNPTANSDATPADVLRWSEGRALVATGSPFDAGADRRADAPDRAGQQRVHLPRRGPGGHRGPGHRGDRPHVRSRRDHAGGPGLQRTVSPRARSTRRSPTCGRYRGPSRSRWPAKPATAGYRCWRLARTSRPRWTRPDGYPATGN